MEPYTGFEPRVGEIRALRTFRIGPGGRLHSLFSDTAWVDGANAARCLRTGDGPGAVPPHAAPDDDCTCGFYAYGSAGAAAEQPHARHVLGAVACWGRVIAGTRGLRAEHCRVEALFLSGAVPPDLVQLVRERYPSVAVYRSRSEMLAAHPATELDCYQPAVRRGRPLVRSWLRWAAALAVVLGTVPASWLGGVGGARTVRVAVLGLFLLAALVWGWRRPGERDAQQDVVLCLAVAAWLIAPFALFPGVLFLRMALGEVAVLGLIQRIRMMRAARRFPADVP